MLFSKEDAQHASSLIPLPSFEGTLSIRTQRRRFSLLSQVAAVAKAAAVLHSTRRGHLPRRVPAPSRHDERSGRSLRRLAVGVSPHSHPAPSSRNSPASTTVCVASTSFSSVPIRRSKSPFPAAPTVDPLRRQRRPHSLSGPRMAAPRERLPAAARAAQAVSRLAPRLARALLLPAPRSQLLLA